MFYVVDRAIYVSLADIPEDADIIEFATVEEAVSSLLKKKKKITVKKKKETFETYYQHPDYCGDCIAYVDGSTINNGQKDSRGGFGVFFPKSLVNEEITISEPLLAHEKVTNNTAELRAMTRALEIIAERKLSPVTIVYDSQYAYKAISGINSSRSNIKLVGAGKKALRQCQKAGIEVTFKHVYSHTNYRDLDSCGNEIVDELAKNSYASKLAG